MPITVPVMYNYNGVGIITVKILIACERMAEHVKCYREDVKENEKRKKSLDPPIRRPLRSKGE